MSVDIRESISVTILPLVIVLTSYFFLDQLSQPLPPVLHTLLPFLPYIIFIIGMTLSWIFHHSREFNIFLLLAVIYIFLDNYMWNSESKVDVQLTYLLVVAIIPVNYLFNLLSRERGILNKFGIRRYFILAIQVYGVLWLLDNSFPIVKKYLSFTHYNHPILKETDISQPLILIITITFLIILFRLLQTSSILTSGILFSFVSIISALHFYQQPQLAIIYLLMSGSIIIISIIINAYSLAYLDGLTNLPSRRALNQNTSSLGNTYCIAMVDIDHFKKFNDKYGHDIGDQVLKKLASQLRQVKGGKAFRYGGEEFTILFPNKSIQEAKIYCDELCKKVENNPFILRSKKRPKNKKKVNKRNKFIVKNLTITISIGVAERTKQLTTAEDVIKKADKALYKAKNKGRNQVAV